VVLNISQFSKTVELLRTTRPKGKPQVTQGNQCRVNAIDPSSSKPAWENKHLKPRFSVLRDLLRTDELHTSFRNHETFIGSKRMVLTQGGVEWWSCRLDSSERFLPCVG